MKAALKSLAEHFDSRMKEEDPNYLLELKAKEAVRSLVKELKSLGECVNEKNVLIEAQKTVIHMKLNCLRSLKRFLNKKLVKMK